MSASAEIVKYVRYSYGGRESYGIVEGDVVADLAGSIFDNATRTGLGVPLAEVRLLVPTQPSKVIAIGLNYASHRVHVEKSEGVFVSVNGRPGDPTIPIVFAKFPSSLIPDGADIHFPEGASNVHFEGELALVIGKEARNVPPEKARDYVFGATICNDLVEREWLLNDLQWFRAKGSDGFGPVGPWIVTGLDYGNLGLKTRVNGETRQSSNTSELVFSPDVFLSYCSRFVTLMPGDVIFTGTPGQTQQVTHGDVIEVEIEGIGVLRNQVA
jgi:2-keto-4-pentenoate hydratase/2-oxohepta-3-ene-1,7-dioic acid hydratase in catechol pathway